MTVSHLRFGPEPIKAPWLVDMAHYIGVHQAAYFSKCVRGGQAHVGAAQGALGGCSGGGWVLQETPHGAAAERAVCCSPRRAPRFDTLAGLRPGGTVLINAPWKSFEEVEQQMHPMARSRIAQLRPKVRRPAAHAW